MNDYMQNKMRAKMKKGVCQKVALFTTGGKKNREIELFLYFTSFFCLQVVIIYTGKNS